MRPDPASAGGKIFAITAGAYILFAAFRIANIDPDTMFLRIGLGSLFAVKRHTDLRLHIA